MASFVQLLGKHPTLLLKLITSSLFITLGLTIVSGVLDLGSGDNARYLYGGLILVYGFFRLFTFYTEYKDRTNETHSTD